MKPPAPEGVTGTVTVPLKYHHAVTQQGNFFRTLRSYHVQVEQSASPKGAAVPPRPAQNGGDSVARIDDPTDGAVVEAQWQVVPNYQDAEEGEAVWTFKAQDQAALDKAVELTHEALKHAEEMSHVGFLTLPDRSAFPRIVGAKGSNVARLRAESQADITVSREDNTIVIVGTCSLQSSACCVLVTDEPSGSESAIESAKEAILRMTVSRPPPRGGRRDRD